MLYNKIVDRDGNVTAIIGNWTKGDNLNKFNELLRAGLEKADAAKETFTGKLAKDREFTEVKILKGSKLNADGKTYSSVRVEFTKPNQ